jgi:hypothetical protein
MSDQSTRATAPNPDPRTLFTLSQEDAQALYGAANHGEEATNCWWLNAGQRLHFVWTTVDDLAWLLDNSGEGVTIAPELDVSRITGATFTAWPETLPIAEDQEALDWLEAREPGWEAYWTMEGSDPSFGLDVVLAAFTAGRDHGFAMGSAIVQAQAETGWDGMELVRESAELLRELEKGERNQGDMLIELDPEGAAIHHTAAERQGDLAECLESFLYDPAQSHLVHDGLREAREDAANGVVVGWTAALSAIRELVDDMQKHTGPSALPPLVLLSRIPMLKAPEDMDEVLAPWRGVGPALIELREARNLKGATNAGNLHWALEAIKAWREWVDKSVWVDELMRTDAMPKSMRYLGQHKADTIREVVQYFMKAAKDLLDDRMVGLRVQAAGDALQAMGITRQACTCPDGGGIEVGCPAHDVQERPGYAAGVIHEPGTDPDEETDPTATMRTIEAAADSGLFKVHGIGSAAELRTWATERLDRADLERGLIPRTADTRQATPGVYTQDQGGNRSPIAPGLECEGDGRPPFASWQGSSFVDGDIVEVREPDGHCLPMKVGSLQFQNALNEMGQRMAVREATPEQRKGWEA